jgi:hypothetical protein
MPARRRKGRKRTTATRRKRTSVRRVKGAKGVRVTKGRVAIKVAGHGVTKLAASQLVRFVPLTKLKSAAKKVLASLGHRGKRKKKKKHRVSKRRAVRRRKRRQ